jgi:hypothetical protein
MTKVNIVHDPEGIVFRKYEAESGITYLSVPIEEVDVNDTSLLVRHGTIHDDKCGYYPLNLLFKDRNTQMFVAKRAQRKAPSVRWINTMKQRLERAGVSTC